MSISSCVHKYAIRAINFKCIKKSRYSKLHHFHFIYLTVKWTPAIGYTLKIDIKIKELSGYQPLRFVDLNGDGVKDIVYSILTKSKKLKGAAYINNHKSKTFVKDAKFELPVPLATKENSDTGIPNCYTFCLG